MSTGHDLPLGAVTTTQPPIQLQFTQAVMTMPQLDLQSLPAVNFIRGEIRQASIPTCACFHQENFL